VPPVDVKITFWNKKLPIAFRSHYRGAGARYRGVRSHYRGTRCPFPGGQDSFHGGGQVPITGGSGPIIGRAGAHYWGQPAPPYRGGLSVARAVSRRL